MRGRNKEDYIGKLSGYIKKNLKKGYTIDSLKYALINQGHSRLEVDKAVKRVQDEQSREAPILETKPSIVYEAVDIEHNPLDIQENRPWWKKLFRIK